MSPGDRKVLILCTILLGFSLGGVPAARALSQALVQLYSPAPIPVDASGSPELLTPLPAVGLVSAMCVINSSTTCVYVGGSDVSGTGTVTGVGVGDGCEAGKVFCPSASRVWGESASGTVNVRTIYGAQGDN